MRVNRCKVEVGPSERFRTSSRTNMLSMLCLELGLGLGLGAVLIGWSA